MAEPDPATQRTCRRSITTRALPLLLALLAMLLACPALAAESAAVSTARDTATLVSDTDAVAPGTPFHVGLRLRLGPGWHTYWRNPGDAGVPAEIKLSLPAGASAGPIEWPMPERVAEGALMTYAYTGEVLLPLTITPARDGGATRVEASADWLVCKDICIPEQAQFVLDLPAGPPVPSAEAPLFARAAEARPVSSPWDASIAADGQLWVRGERLGPDTVAAAWFIPDRPGEIRDAAPQPLTVREGGFVLALRPAAGFDPAGGISGILAVRDSSGQEADVSLRAAPGPVPPLASYVPWPRMLGLAFLGGLILNLMPCVFPVLAVKALSFAEGAARGRAGGHAVAYVAGVLMAFAGLGGAMITLRAAGAAAGWGFQFQSPAFVAGMSWLLFAVGLNLSGVFQIGAGLIGAGHRFTQRDGQAGSFFTGLLAVIVATPCTAPFMGAAIAGALAAPPAFAMLVFLAMGLGLAAPYALLVTVPGVARVVPRPGRWMELLRQALAFPMYAAAGWLVWVVSRQTGSTGLLGTLAGLLLVGFAAWVVGAAQTSAGRGRRLGQSVAVAAGLTALAVLGGIAGAPPPVVAAQAGVEPFSPVRLAALRQEGRPVFVDMTADWCVTCLLNERVAIDVPAVRQAFAARKVAYLRGDWTRQDPAVSAFLRAHGRDGVPLYVFYPPHGGAPVVLPQILSESVVLREVNGGARG